MKTHIPDGLMESNLPKDSPFGIRGVSETQLSVARFFGVIRFCGRHYTYFPDTDELVRDDVLRWDAERQLKAQDLAIATKVNMRDGLLFPELSAKDSESLA